MALSEQERQIAEYGYKAGKTKEQVLEAISNYRSSVAKESAPKSGFTEAVKDAPSDVMETGKRIFSSINESGKDILDTAGRTDRNMAQKTTMIAGKFAGGAASAIGELFTGAMKLIVSPETERKIKEKVQSGAERVLSTEQAQEIMSKYRSLSPEAREQVDAAGGVASLLTELAGFKGAGKALDEAADVSLAALKAGSRTGRQLADTTVERVGGATRKLADTAAGPIQAGKELVERVPRALEHMKDKASEAAARAERIRLASPATQEAIKVNLNDAIISSVEAADDATVQAYKKIADIAAEPKSTLGVKKRPEIVAGEAASEQYKLINKQRQKVGKDIGEAVDNLSGQKEPVDMTAGYQRLNDVLASEGITVSSGKKGVQLDFSGSRFTPAERTKIRELYKLATETGKNISPSELYKRDNLFSKLQRESRFEGIGDIFVNTAEGDQSLFRVFRDIFSDKLEEVATDDIRALNREYRKLRTLQDDIEASLVKTGNFTNAGTDLAEFAQTNLRRLGSDAQSAAAYREIAAQMDKLARELGYEGANPEDLINFATEMRNLFPDKIPPTSFTGITQNFPNKAFGSRILGAAEDLITKGGAPNVSDQQKALIKLLEETLQARASKSPKI